MTIEQIKLLIEILENAQLGVTQCRVDNEQSEVDVIELEQLGWYVVNKTDFDEIDCAISEALAEMQSVLNRGQ